MQEFDINVSPVSGLKGEVNIPGDKSITHRGIILSAISNATVTLKNWLNSADCLNTLRAINELGIKTKINNNELKIYGNGLYGLKKPNKVLDLGNSGTGIRLLTGVLSAQSFNSELTGDKSLIKRPMKRIISPLKEMGVNIVATNDNFAPLKINPAKELTPINHILKVGSAQVKSAILLAGIYTDFKTKVIDNFNCRNHTEKMLEYMQNYLTNNNEVKNKELLIDVPGDISSSAFFIVAALITKGSDIVMHNIGINPTRTGIITILKKMGADITIFNEKVVSNEPRASIRVKSSQLQGVKFNKDIVPKAIDEFPVLFIAAACAKGETIFTGLSELKVKESNRVFSMIKGLNKLGINAEEYKDGVKIMGGVINSGTIDSCSDHRVAMSFAIAALVAKNKIIVKNAANIATSFPSFFDELNVMK